MAIKLLIGGSPCTHWSIAQKNNRETTAEGTGWELFRNYLIIKEKFKPDFFLYENNKSAAQPIKNQISSELGVPLMYINSSLVSAQNRQRFYAFNWTVEQPQDRGIMLSDILESGQELCGNDKSYCLTATYGKAIPQNTLQRKQRTMISEPLRIGTIESGTQTQHDSKPYRVYSPYGKSVTIQGEAGGMGAKTGLYACPVISNNGGIENADRRETKTIYEVKNNEIEIRDRLYPINLPDGFYIIRKLTVTECCRLQTLPDDYCRTISNTQAYKGLGNGWTAEIIIHILSGALKDVPRSEEILCLSMYDGIGTGRYCLDRMGFKNVRYYAYEIDKFAMTVANSNFRDIIQCGDAFDVRRDEWTL